MKLEILERFRTEAHEAVDWYRARNPQTAERLADLIVEGIQDIFAHPRMFPLYEIPRNPGDIRRKRVPDFPFVIVYQLIDEELVIMAIAHTSKRPGYWKSRVRKRK